MKYTAAAAAAVLNLLAVQVAALYDPCALLVLEEDRYVNGLVCDQTQKTTTAVLGFAYSSYDELALVLVRMILLYKLYQVHKYAFISWRTRSTWTKTLCGDLKYHGTAVRIIRAPGKTRHS